MNPQLSATQPISIRNGPTDRNVTLKPGKAITRSEARSLALEILQRAERERAEIAQAEAERGINWEEEPEGDE
jgi:hypothetical protein